MYFYTVSINLECQRSSHALFSGYLNKHGPTAGKRKQNQLAKDRYFGRKASRKDV
jgi:hypothetical protein